MEKLGNSELSNNEKWFQEKKINLKYKKRNRVYTIHGDYKRKLYPNPHTSPIFYVSLRAGDARLTMISIFDNIQIIHENI